MWPPLCAIVPESEAEIGTVEEFDGPARTAELWTVMPLSWNCRENGFFVLLVAPRLEQDTATRSADRSTMMFAIAWRAGSIKGGASSCINRALDLTLGFYMIGSGNETPSELRSTDILYVSSKSGKNPLEFLRPHRSDNPPRPTFSSSTVESLCGEVSGPVGSVMESA